MTESFPQKEAVPGYWKGFLRVAENKEELFQMPATKLETLRIGGKQIVSTCSSSFLSSPKMADDNCLHP